MKFDRFVLEATSENIARQTRSTALACHRYEKWKFSLVALNQFESQSRKIY
jgi:hypothetical protein